MNVYVPALEVTALALHGILGCSGIVGEDPGDAERTMIYYEGNKYRFANVHTWADRVLVAAHRLATRYPTTACRLVPNSSLHKVGELLIGAQFDLRITDREAVASWLNDPDDLDLELEISHA